MSEKVETKATILGSVTQIVSAHLSNNAVAVSEVPSFIRAVHTTLAELESATSAGLDLPQTDRPPAVPIEDSVHHDYIVCLEDGKRLRMLKRYLMAQYRLTPDAYRKRWNLPDDYPMAAPALTEQRRSSAVDRGLGKSTPKKRRR